MTRDGTPAPWRYRLAMALWQGALALAEPLVWRYFRRRAEKDPDYMAAPAERRGEGPDFAADIWVHAVSLGEYRSAEPVLRPLLAAGRRIVLTHATPAGRRASEAGLAGEIAAGQVAVRWAPIDRARYWRQFFAVHRPRIGLVFELEFWPGMAEAAAASGVPLWFVNSQVPAKSWARARALRALTGTHPAARGAGVLAKSERMAARFRDLGARDVRVMGETRFDIPPPQAHLDAAADLRKTLSGRKVVTFASVIAGEEETYLAAVAMLGEALEDPLIIWVPRAPELFGATCDRLAAAGLAVARRSEAFDTALALRTTLDGVQVLLGDSFGEMFFYLSAADVVSVGGGFVEKGAHNVIEPLALGKPVVTGPHVATIEFPGVEAQAAGVLSVCRDGPELAPALLGLLGADPAAALAFHAENRGAAERIAEFALAATEGQGA